MRYKAAIIGYGGMGAWHHRSIEEKVPELQVAAAWDIREEARAKAAALGLRVYASLQELLEDAGVRLVIVATPNNFHKEITIACLQAGKAVICEKPVAMNAGELREMMAAAEETGQLFSIHQNRRWDQDYLTIKQLLDKNTLGRPYFIESRVQGSRGAMHGWRGYRVNGGGMLLDWGVHLLDQMLLLVKSPVIGVGGHLHHVFTPEVEDSIKLFLRFENGVSALLEMSTNCFVRHPRWHVSCVAGTAVIDDWAGEGRMVQLGENGDMGWEDDIVYTEAGPTRTMAPRPAHTTRELPLPGAKGDWAEYYRNIAAVLDGREELLVRPDQALRVMEVIDLLFASQADGGFATCNI